MMKIILKYYNNFNKIVKSNQWNTCICDISNTIHTFYMYLNNNIEQSSKFISRKMLTTDEKLLWTI